MITVQDLSAVLSESGRSDLAAYPTKYDVTVELNGQWPTLDGLTQAAHNCVTSPNKLCIFIDPTHHHVAVRFGTDTGVMPANFDMVSKAGNASFHAGDWVNGVKAILSRAEVTSVKSNQATAVIVQQSTVEHPMPVWPWVLGLGIMAMLGMVIVAMVRRRARRLMTEANDRIDDVRREAGELAQRNIQRQTEDDFDEALRKKIKTVLKPVPVLAAEVAEEHPAPRGPLIPESPTYVSLYSRYNKVPKKRTPVSKVVIVQQQQSPGISLGDVLIADALLDNASARREDVRREERYEERHHHTPTPAPRVYDGGGSSSSDSDSDSGGSSSSFDGGGSSDSGGGGGDF